MRFWSSFSTVGALAISVASLWHPYRAQAQSPTPLFTADQEACFGRVYDKSHLSRHPDQKVTSIHIFRYLSERTEAEYWRPNQRAETIKQFRETDHAYLKVFVTFRDRKGYFHQYVMCHPGSNTNALCSVECDQGTFDLKRESPTTVLLHNHRLVLVGGCGAEADEQEIDLIPGKDDKVFRLERKPPAVCHVEDQKARPISAGKPLRERFGEKEPFCFGREYDAAHLVKHPRQKVVSIRVWRPMQEQEQPDSSNPLQWPEEVKLSVSLKLDVSGVPRSSSYTCRPQVASWECNADQAAWTSDTRSTCDGNIVQLARGPGNDIMLINRRDGLPIEAPCRPKTKIELTGEEFAGRRTQSDDRVFRLTRMPAEACVLFSK
jgi:hypothetical protein